MRIVIGAIVIIGLCAGCYNQEASQAEVDALMQSELDNKTQAYRQNYLEDCRERLMKEAAEVADSIIIAQARYQRDTAGRPPVPERPDKPEVRTLIDTVPLRPLLEDSLASQR